MKVVAYNKTVSDLLASFASLLPEDTDQEISVLWEITKRMSDLPVGGTRPSSALNYRSKKYLEDSYTKYIKLTVFSNLATAELDGIPGTQTFCQVREAS